MITDSNRPARFVVLDCDESELVMQPIWKTIPLYFVIGPSS